MKKKCSECRFEDVCKDETKERYGKYGCNMFEPKKDE
jgi:hypothetical protein